MGVIRKIAVIVPVVMVSTIYAASHIQQVQQEGHRRMAVLVGSLLLFYAWVFTGIIRRKQDSFFDMLVQASFYVFLFSVLTLTGYFIFFNEVSAHGWWHRVVQRVITRDGVNLKAFLFLRPKNIFTYDVVGNFFMLFPLGTYLPLLYRRIKNIFTVTLTAMLVSLSIELMQLATNFRISDINDVILNTTGAAIGFIVYLLVRKLLVKPLHAAPRASTL